MPERTLIITGSDAGFFPLARGTVRSIRDQADGADVPVAFFDLGCTPDQRDWLGRHVQSVRRAAWEYDFPGRDQLPEAAKALLVRPYLRRYFPGFEYYLWIDADAWVQDWAAVRLLVRGAAKRRGLAIVPQIDRGSWAQYGALPGQWEWAHGHYQATFGPEVAARLRSYPMLNAGVFALHYDAPHWDAWADAVRQALERSGAAYMADQAALNWIVYDGGLFDRTELLPAWCNWTCHFGMPCWDREAGRLVEPYLPHTPIGILHLTGPKQDNYAVPTTDGGTVELSLRYEPARPEPPPPRHAFPAGDYVAPGLATVAADRSFPHLAVGDKRACPWPYLRRDVPHNWYVDGREPTVGLLTRDEAHLLYNTALRFRGRPALEIGCEMGWSACHLALGGVRLDVVDPVLADPVARERVTEALRAAGVLEAVHLVAGASPARVEELAAGGRTWALFFIDGDPRAPAPLFDAEVCDRFAADDALVLVHDLAVPDVAEGLAYLKRQGWQVMVYQTMQLMGVAWRGAVLPVPHRPDPAVRWSLPAHLAEYAVSGWEPPA